MPSPPETFDAFWQVYARAHRHPVNRALHLVGTVACLGTIAAAVATLHPAWLLLLPVAGYGPAWVGHFVFERNRPATWEHPLWSLRCDLKMFVLTLRRKMAPELG